MSSLQLERKTIKTYLTENQTCKLSIVCYNDGIMEVTGHTDNIFATGSVEYWTSMENPIKINQISTVNTLSNISYNDIQPLEPYFNTNMNKGNTPILNGQFKFSVKYTLHSDHFKFPSDPVHIHMVVNVNDKIPVNLDIKMDMTIPLRLIDNKQPTIKYIHQHFMMVIKIMNIMKDVINLDMKKNQIMTIEYLMKLIYQIIELDLVY
jgi:hypothetical protein